MARRRASILDELVQLPWWLCLAFAAIVYFGLRFGLPHLNLGVPVLDGAGAALAQIAWMPAMVCVLAAFGSALRSFSRRRLLDRQASLEDLRALSWQHFEQLVGEAYRRQGYTVVESGGGGPDEGIDLVLRRGAERVAVQCKRWRTARIGVSVVRELLGAMTATGASRGIVVGSGTFTAPAIAFARDNDIELVDGEALAALVADVRRADGTSASDLSAEPSAEASPRAVSSTPVPPVPREEADTAMPSIGSTATAPCPTCGAEMVERTAKRGPNTGRRFLGCSRYPGCRGTRALP